MPYQILFQAYVVFLALVFIGLTLISLRPRAEERHPTRKGFKPKVLVIVPCKGMDITLGTNLLAIMDQSYRNYDVVAVIDSKSDPAFETIKRVGTRYMISDYSCGRCSGKVRALASAIDRYRGYGIYAIMDSDVTVGRRWLADMVAPLADMGIGITTTFPIFKPMGGFWSRVKYLWGFVGQGLMEYKPTRFAWGGSYAFRRSLLDTAAFKRFSESVSDDIPITMTAKGKGLGIAYVESATPIVNSADNFGQLWEWSNRQTALSIREDRRKLFYGVAIYGGNILLLLSGLALAAFANIGYIVLLLPFLIGWIRAYRRTNGMPMALLIYPMMSFLYLSNLITASRLTEISWRGRSYSLKGIRKPL